MGQLVLVHIKQAEALIAKVKNDVLLDVEMPHETPARFSSKQEADHLELEAPRWELDLSSPLSENRLAKARRIHRECD